MSSWNQTRQQPRTVYLELSASGVELRLEERPEKPCGLVLRVGGLGSMPDLQAARTRRLISRHKDGLVRILYLDSDKDLVAVRQEGAA